MLTLSGVARVGRVLAIAVVASACATRTAPTASRHPAPFPGAATPVSIKSEPSGSSLAGSAALIQTALSLEGVPYQWGGDQPSTGFDCSGFVQYVLAQHQIWAPRTAAEQFTIGRGIDIDELRAGDLVFFSTVSPGASHVGLAVNSEEFVHAPASTGVVRVEKVRSSYWRARYFGARRIF